MSSFFSIAYFAVPSTPFVKKGDLRLTTQKEVERKRRNNISEGIDQLVQIMGIPELEKAGKSVQLRRASERVGGLEKEAGELRGEKLDLEVCPLFH
jgi:hypothetical protein